MTRFHSAEGVRGGSGPAARQLSVLLIGGAVAAILAAPVAAIGERPSHAARLDAAFAAARAMPVDAALQARLAGRAGKADRLDAAAGCGSQTWPNIRPACLVAADGSRSVRSVRTVTVEQRVGERTSVLVRLPAAQLAANFND